jgi:hypothetical protein
VKKFGVKIWHFMHAWWRRETIYLLLIGLVLFGILAIVSNVPNQASSVEREFIYNSGTLDEIIRNPVNAPYKIATNLLTTISPSVRVVRALSFVFYIAACVALFLALKCWHTVQVSALATLAFASNAVMLAVARLGAPTITVISFFIFSGLLLWQVHSRSNKLVPVLVILSLAALLYVPGAIWFFLILLIVYGDRVGYLFKNVKRQAIIIGFVLALLLMSPLIISFVSDVNNLKEWLLLPQNIQIDSIPRSILRIPSAYIYRMPVEPLVNIARLPIFDIASGVFFLIGINAYLRKLKLDRTRVMIGASLVAIVIGALGQTILAIVLLLPFAYAVLAAGIEYLVDEWYSVFPKNPYARSFGVILITCAVLFSTYYQLTRFFVVWPQTPETRGVYNQTRIVEKQ